MIATVPGKQGSGRFARGVHPPERKGFAAEAPIEVLPNPPQVAIPLLQHTGAPCEPLVKVKDEVALGQKIGEGKGFITAPVHASVAGTVAMPSVTTLPNGRHVRTIPIKTGPTQLSAEELKANLFGGDWPVSGLDSQAPEQIAQAAREAGLVGLGGAAFPTHVKLTRNEKRPVDTVLLNGCECEPYLTSDYRLMIEFPRPIITGALLAARATGAAQIIIAVEDNKPAAVEALRRAADGTGVEVRVMETRYPMGGERQVIPAALDREVPTGGLPLDVGVVVINVGTAAALAAAVLRGRALTHRVVSVTGAGIAQPKNLLVPVGVSYRGLIDFCGGLKPDAARVIAGGPMMGFALNDLNVTVTKGTSGIVVLTHEDLKQIEETTCVRCGRCVDVCPLHLVPTRLALASRYQDWDMARRYHLMACCECGCCAYVCPAAIPLVQLMRMGKAQLPNE
ncbi:MAG: electron transport complex subunit RsxC [Verrucomicrobia bacterium]|nr:electron transport complex subunit RsxC [Verrucomicrobiota bacterium]